MNEACNASTQIRGQKQRYGGRNGSVFLVCIEASVVREKSSGLRRICRRRRPTRDIWRSRPRESRCGESQAEVTILLLNGENDNVERHKNHKRTKRTHVTVQPSYLTKTLGSDGPSQGGALGVECFKDMRINWEYRFVGCQITLSS